MIAIIKMLERIRPAHDIHLEVARGALNCEPPPLPPPLIIIEMMNDNDG